MPTPKEIERIKALINDPNVSEKTKGLLRTKLDTYLASKAPSVAPPAPAVAPVEALGGGGPGGAVGGGGGSAPGGDPYEEAHAAREAELGTSAPEEPGPSLPPPSLWQEIGGASASALAGLDSTVTGGVLTALTRKAAPEIGQAVDMARAEFPWANIAARVAGMRVPGLGRSIGKLSAEGAGLKAGQGIANTVMRGGLAGGAGAGTQGAVEAVVAGEDPLEAFGSAYPIGFLLGMPSALVGKAGEWLRNRNRDPLTPSGRDLQLAEKGGATTDTVSGIEPSPKVAELSAEAKRLGGVSPESVAAKNAAPILGRELQHQIGKTLGGIKMQNQAGYEELGETSLRPLMTKQLAILRDATHDGRLLPGQNVKETVQALRRTADVRVVPRTSPEAHMAEADDMMDVGLARHLGIVRGSGSPADAENVVVFMPRSADARAIDATARVLDARANVKAGNYDPAKLPAKQMGAAVREAREGLGEEWATTKADQSRALTQMKNSLEASGLPRETEAVDLGDFGTMDALYKAVRRYRTEGNAIADAELDRLASGNTGLRELLDTFAGTSATQRLLGQADLGMTPAGNVSPHGFTGAARLRLDPLARWLSTGSMVPVPAAASAITEQRRSK